MSDRRVSPRTWLRHLLWRRQTATRALGEGPARRTREQAWDAFVATGGYSGAGVYAWDAWRERWIKVSQR